MITVTVMYPKTEQSQFDFDYYLHTHADLVKQAFGPFGLQDVRLLRGTALLDGSKPQFEVIAQLMFASMQDLQNALQAHGQEIVADIAKFTNVQPTIQINEPL
jgi:uncharacterized protein (TIGR02118 family)